MYATASWRSSGAYSGLPQSATLTASNCAPRGQSRRQSHEEGLPSVAAARTAASPAGPARSLGPCHPGHPPAPTSSRHDQQQQPRRRLTPTHLAVGAALAALGRYRLQPGSRQALRDAALRGGQVCVAHLQPFDALPPTCHQALVTGPAPAGQLPAQHRPCLQTPKALQAPQPSAGAMTGSTPTACALRGCARYLPAAPLGSPLAAPRQTPPCARASQSLRQRVPGAGAQGERVRGGAPPPARQTRLLSPASRLPSGAEGNRRIRVHDGTALPQ